MNVRVAWLAEVELALNNAGQGDWWAALPLTLDGICAVMMGHIADAPPKQAEIWRDYLTETFLKHLGGWWNSLERVPSNAIAPVKCHSTD